MWVTGDFRHRGSERPCAALHFQAILGRDNLDGEIITARTTASRISPAIRDTWKGWVVTRLPAAEDALFGLIEKGALRIAFHLEEHLREIKALRAKYRDRPISLADACLVRMVGLFDDHHVFTLDSDFTVYRKHGRKSLALIHPSGE